MASASPPTRPEMQAGPGRRRRGRRPAGADTRAEILARAREMFFTEGYDRTSIRAVARAAGVDPALVHHYFAGKPGLFSESVLPNGLNPLDHLSDLDGVPHQELGKALVRSFLEQWDGVSPEQARAAVLATVAPASQAQPLREFVLREVLARVPLPPQPPEQAAVRRELVGSQLLGLALCRYAMTMPFLHAAGVDDVVSALAPVLQGYLDDPLPCQVRARAEALVEQQDPT